MKAKYKKNELIRNSLGLNITTGKHTQILRYILLVSVWKTSWK